MGYAIEPDESHTTIRWGSAGMFEPNMVRKAREGSLKGRCWHSGAGPEVEPIVPPSAYAHPRDVHSGVGFLIFLNEHTEWLRHGSL